MPFGCLAGIARYSDLRQHSRELNLNLAPEQPCGEPQSHPGASALPNLIPDEPTSLIKDSLHHLLSPTPANGDFVVANLEAVPLQCLYFIFGDDIGFMDPKKMVPW